MTNHRQRFSGRVVGRVTLAVLVALPAACAPGPTVQPVLMVDKVDAKASAAALYDAGKAHLRAGRVGLAVHAFEAARLAAPRSVDVLNGLGAAYDALGRHHLAEDAYLRALAVAPEDPTTLNNLGWSRYLRGHPRQAEFYLRQAADLAPEDPVVQANLARVMADLPALPERRRPDLRTATGPRVERRTMTVQELVLAPEPSVDWPPASHPVLDRLETHAIVVSLATDRETAGSGPVRQAAAALRVEIANGTGRRRMAARFGRWLAGRGFAVAWLSNADTFDHGRTVVSYRNAKDRRHAERLVAALPAAAVVRRDAHQRADLRVVLGADLLDFDQRLKTANTNARKTDDASSDPHV